MSGESIRQPFTAREDAEMRRMCGVAATVGDIAQELGRAPSSVRLRLEKLGLEARRVRWSSEGGGARRTAPEPRRQKGDAEGSVGQPWSDFELRQLAHFMETDMKHQSIANSMGRRASEVGVQIERIRRGIVKVPKGPERYRGCIRCGDTFWSTGAGHRHCDSCRSHLTANTEVDPYSVVTRRDKAVAGVR
ncbi:MAG: hypothetical protein P1U37_06690 [Minwuia sp.]|nr:hypothetical protein [Minwuia sp.]